MPADSPASDLLIHVCAEELHAADCREAISHMAGSFARQAGLPDATPLIDSAMQREYCEPTYLGKGMALPHARVAGLAGAGVCIAHSAAGIPWHGERAHLIVFLAVPEEAPELYLKLMSRIVRWRLRLPDSALTSPTLPAEAWERRLRAELAH